MKSGLRIGAIGILATAGVIGAALWKADWANWTVTGKQIISHGPAVGIGSFPCNSVLSPDGKFLVTTNAGYREQLTVVEVTSGKIVDVKEFNAGGRRSKEGLYYGLCWSNGSLFVSRGTEGKATQFNLTSEGKLEFKADITLSGRTITGQLAGVAVVGDKLYIAENNFDKKNKNVGYVHEVAIATGSVTRTFEVGGYPLQVITDGNRLYVSSERDSVVNTVELSSGKVGAIKVGTMPVGLTIAGTKLYVANSGSDTISTIDIATSKVDSTVLIRPAEMRGIPSCSPLSIDIDQASNTAYVALADMNAVAVVDLKSRKLSGYVPVGWYPTSVKIANSKLFVTNAKGVVARNPNSTNQGPDGSWGKYDANIIEGTLDAIQIPVDVDKLKTFSMQAVAANRFDQKTVPTSFVKPKINHIIYIVKENRTYDQVFGDLPRGNGDPSLCLFPREVTPNQHALAERFAQMDDFYVCAEISEDGWNWSTSGMMNQYGERNYFNNYSGRRQGYDGEGENEGVKVDLKGLPDVSASPGGYIWDNCAKSGKTYRNYGFFVGEVEPLGSADGDVPPKVNVANKKALLDHTDTSFRHYDLAYADSDLWKEYGLDVKSQMKTYGEYKSTSRFAEWKREFDQFVQNGKMPQFSTVRISRDHTAGTAAGRYSPRAMVADNDYAVGEIVDAVSHSPYWKDTVICVLEDDAQAGFDHVDCHRSNALVISPYIEKNTLYSKFCNTDSMIRTMEVLLGMPPMTGYDAVAPLIEVFGKNASNIEPFSAIKPDRAIASEINKSNAYRAADSARLIARFQEESMPDVELNDILWGSIKGANSRRPLVRR